MELGPEKMTPDDIILIPLLQILALCKMMILIMVRTFIKTWEEADAESIGV